MCMCFIFIDSGSCVWKVGLSEIIWLVQDFISIIRVFFWGVIATCTMVADWIGFFEVIFITSDLDDSDNSCSRSLQFARQIFWYAADVDNLIFITVVVTICSHDYLVSILCLKICELNYALQPLAGAFSLPLSVSLSLSHGHGWVLSFVRILMERVI